MEIKGFLLKYKPKLFTFRFSLFALLLLIAVTGCGYKPSSHAIENIFSDTVYVEVYVDRAEPENAPFIKDEMNRMVYTRFKGKIVSKKQAQSQIIVSYAGTTFTPLAYKNGYVTRYRADVRVTFDMITKQGKLKKTYYCDTRRRYPSQLPSLLYAENPSDSQRTGKSYE